ncbi:hypothetical protein PsYK624_115960 [Phanerochaete sordida]|uniref:DUF6535 domain-containing protein n=1 Tax=Phanerochaete sordida TaxID=48140 RepID=A0A9P3LIQ2_9APHY|nr:hypothetical protein PsYK624_115960 [Phanerochaete sordida]
MDAGAAYAKTGPGTTQTNASNIWQTMVQTVRTSDTQKVDDTKEDIDTLLVFAGLFSAVVTTFLVATYPSLQPDNTDELVFLMRQSLAQNYSFVDGVLRPMAPFPNDPPFEIPLWALRVNGLWFASLIVSLSTASFGMLVKQWLIEYVAMEQWISPEEQLRARQYRLPGLRHWKVFEIAAVLPLLLHISLGLFFVGLSFYTAAANETIGRATFTLVAGWAFFALLTLVAPLASPRCPYKVTLFKAALRVGRRYVTSHLWKPGRAAIDGAAGAARWVWVNIFCLPYRVGSAFMDGLYSLLRWAKQVSRLLWLPICTVLLPFLLVGGALSYLKRFVAYIVSDHETDTVEEEDVMHKAYQMHELLLSVDELIINDGPVLSTMAELLRQTRTEPQFVMAFVLGCIRHRITAANRDKWIPAIEEPVRGLLDLQILTASAWEVLAKLMGETLKSKMPESTVVVTFASEADNPWMTNAAAVLLSRSQWPFPEQVHQLLVDDAMLAKVLHLVRKPIAQWPVRDVLHVIWVAITAPDRNPGAPARALEKRWTRLPTTNRQERILTSLQVVIMQIILENAWREHEGGSRHSIEAIQMLAHMLRTTLPVMDVHEHEKQLSQSSTHGSDLEDAAATYPEFPLEYFGVADYLGVVVGTSRELIESALKLYSAYFHKSLAPRRHESLWAGIHRTDSRELSSSDMKPLMLDLWRFLLRCARAAAESSGGGDHLQTEEFVKLCLVLARPDVPRVFGREDPAADWGELVPILEKTASEKRLYRSGPSPGDSAQSEGTIPALAHRALEGLHNADHEAPEQLVHVLEQIVEKAAKLPTEPDEPDEGILGYGRRLFAASRRPRDLSPTQEIGTRDILGPFVQPPGNDGGPSPASDHAGSPAQTNRPHRASRAVSASGEENDATYTNRPRGRGNSASGTARERNLRDSTATASRGRAFAPQLSSSSQAERARHSRNRSRSPPVTIENSYVSSPDRVSYNTRRSTASAAPLPSRQIAMSFSSRQSLTAVSTRLSVQAPSRPTRVLPVQVSVPPSASTSTSIGPLSRAAHMNVPPPLFMPSAPPLTGNIPAAVASSAQTIGSVPSISIHSASSLAIPIPGPIDSSAGSSIHIVLPPGEHPAPRSIGAHQAPLAPQAAATVYVTPAQRLASTRTSSTPPSLVLSRSSGIAVGAPFVGASQHNSHSRQAAFPAIPAEIIVGDAPSDSASVASQSVHAAWSTENHGSLMRQQGRSQSVDLEAGPVDIPQRAYPRRSRSTSQTPSSYSFARAEP